MFDCCKKKKSFSTQEVDETPQSGDSFSRQNVSQETLCHKINLLHFRRGPTLLCPRRSALTHKHFAGQESGLAKGPRHGQADRGGVGAVGVGGVGSGWRAAFITGAVGPTAAINTCSLRPSALCTSSPFHRSGSPTPGNTLKSKMAIVWCHLESAHARTRKGTHTQTHTFHPLSWAPLPTCHN